MYVHPSICIYTVYTCTYNVCTCLTFLKMYIHVKYMSVPFFQILSRWSGFQMDSESDSGSGSACWHTAAAMTVPQCGMGRGLTTDERAGTDSERDVVSCLRGYLMPIELRPGNLKFDSFKNLKSIWNPDHLDRIWKNGIDMYLTCMYMLRNVKHVHTLYVHVYTMYIQIDRCTYMSVHLCKCLYVSCT